MMECLRDDMKEYKIKIGTAFLLVLAYFGIALYQVKYPIAEQRGTT